jgi:hypothetical protein
MIYMSLAKNIGGKVGVKENFKGGRGQKILKILLQICKNFERSLENGLFSQKSKKNSSKLPF